ncbi:4-amino-4-deoxy-L-arabinose transferase [Catalinimonas alkaloidigena]|uniref:4-amino-4-deoxy-L-arabinose transferase n=1 Tax=Catalinimonas alkaloidigena TaxID=1075417 RepID=A0A1G8WT39_9BACT|nr:glycosyltransferase family 39 protein [Catalinimonas alkaloidigena]SDJ81549.1 4-amino-4-deoxy-L-arabinose transferase [Catalinimonas alkaloidigena]
MTLSSQRSIHFFLLPPFLILAYFALFWRLGHPALYIWDESLRAVSAMDMVEGGSWLVNQHTTKPPLMKWIQAVCLQLFGFSEVALRLPSALSGLGTALLLIWFCSREIRQPLIGYLSALVLLSAYGYVGPHATRTADTDAPLTLFLTISCFAYYRLLEHDRRRTLYLLLCAGAILIASLIKGIAGLFFLPGLFLYALFRGKLGVLFKFWQLYAAIGVFVFAIVTYYVVREWNNPGYFAHVWQYELGGRFGGVVQGHKGGPYYYLTNLITERFTPWIFVLPFILPFLFLHPTRPYHPLVVLSLCCALSLLLVLSVASTKIAWYDVPTYPFLALLTSIGIFLMADYFIMLYRLPFRAWHATVVVFLVLFIPSYRWILHKNRFPLGFSYYINWSQLEYGPFMQHLKETNPSLKEYYILNPLNNTHLYYYVHAYNHAYQYQLTHLSQIAQLPVGATVMTCESSYLPPLAAQYDYVTLESYGHCRLLKLVRPHVADSTQLTLQP